MTLTNSALVQKVNKLPDTSFKTVDVMLQYLTNHLRDSDIADKVDLNPVFQRGHVWTLEQQIAFVENFVRGPQYVNRIIYFNDGVFFNKLAPNAENSFIAGKYVCLDGLQRLTALLDFIDGKFNIFENEVSFKGIQESSQEHRFEVLRNCNLKFCELHLKTNQEVIDFYVRLNSAGVAHTKEEIERVKNLI